ALKTAARNATRNPAKPQKRDRPGGILALGFRCDAPPLGWDLAGPLGARPREISEALGAKVRQAPPPNTPTRRPRTPGIHPARPLPVDQGARKTGESGQG